MLLEVSALKINPPRAYLQAKQNVMANQGGSKLDVTLDPPPPTPKLDIILVFGSKDVTDAICTRLASDLGFNHFDVQQYLADLNAAYKAHGDHFTADKTPPGLLHPLALEEMLAKEKPIMARFLIPILRYKVDQDVARGKTQFVMSGMPDDVWTVVEFEQSISNLATIISFQQQGERMPSKRRLIENHFVEKIIKIEVQSNADGIEGAYSRLLQAFGERAMRASPTKPAQAAPANVGLALIVSETAEADTNAEADPEAEAKAKAKARLKATGAKATATAREDTPMRDVDESVGRDDSGSPRKRKQSECA